MSEPIGIAICGAGLFAKQAHLPALKALPPNTGILKAIYSRSTKSSSSLAEFASSELGTPVEVYSEEQGGDKGLDALLARTDIQAVIVVMPINSQPAMVLKCLAAGKHVLSEKPIAQTVQHAQAAIASYKEQFESKGLFWRIAENFEVEPAYLYARDVLASGKIGNVSHWRLTMTDSIKVETSLYAQTKWRATPEYQGGFLLDGGVHSVALLRTILPTKMTSLSAFASLSNPVLPPHDTIHAVVTCAPQSSSSTPAHGIFDMTFGAPDTNRIDPSVTGAYVLVTGTSGWLGIHKTTMEGGVRGMRVDVHVKGSDKPEIFESRVQGVEREVENFLKLVKSSGKEDVGGGLLEGALSDVSFIESALTSDGKPLNLL
ncbi:NAD-binding protein [Clavulina sp. PMI_390]|nr:NAD-binding protein [Clavulina sp. PMI_390]